MAHHRVQDVRSEVKEGDQVLVKVVSIDPSGKIRLSRKALLEDTQGGAPGEGGSAPGGSAPGGGHDRPHGGEHRGGRDHRGGGEHRGGGRRDEHRREPARGGGRPR
jgi:polyribonucleotide nucleotidyltransferase